MADRLVDDTGRVWPVESAGMARRIGAPPASVDPITHAVWNLGFVHVKSANELLVASLRPHLVSRLAMIGILDLIVRTQPKGVLVRDVTKPRVQELFPSIDQALVRIEELADAGYGEFRPMYASMRQPLEGLATTAHGRLAPLLCLWREANARWRPEIRDDLGQRNLWDGSIIYSAETESGDFVIRHWGIKLNLVDAAWRRVAVGRAIEAHPIRGFGPRIAAEYRQLRKDADARLDRIDLVVRIVGGKTVRRCYDRLMLPWHGTAGEPVVTEHNIARWTKVLA
jgi:hypothetical protein